jgi:hypothetical protein
MWRNASLFEADAGGECGLYLREFEDGAGELVLFSRRKDARTAATPETRFRFEGFVRAHLVRNALAGTVNVQRLFVCGECGNAVPQPYVEMLRARGLQRFDCPCGGKVLLAEPREQIDLAREAVNAMESASDRGRNLGVSDTVVKGKEELGEYDVFLCYNSRDRDAVMEIAGGLRERKIRPWLDVWELRAGDVWIDRIGEIITKVKSAAVFIGPNQTGPFENVEIRALLRRFVDSGVRVIPVILSGAEGEPSWSVFMQDFHRVDFRRPQPDPMGELLYGITGVRPELI